MGGYQLYQGILRQDAPTVVGFVTVLVLVFLLANLLVDLLYARARPEDPLCLSRRPSDHAPGRHGDRGRSLRRRARRGPGRRPPEAPPEARSLWSDAWRDLRRNPVFIISALIIVFLVIIRSGRS